MPVRIPSDQHQTVVSVLREAARVNGDVEAYVEPDGEGGRRTLTFAQWDRAADGVAGRLSDLGVTKGDVVCLLLPSCIDYAVLYAALLRLGAITSGINPRMGARRGGFHRGSRRPRAHGGRPRHRPASRCGISRGGHPRPRPGPGGTGRRRRHGPSWPRPIRWPSSGPAGRPGEPKGAVFDHANLAAVARGTDVLSHPGDRRLSPLPFAHVGYMTRAWDEIGNAVTTIITPTPWRADAAIRVMADEGGHGRAGRPDTMGAHAGQRGARHAPTWVPCGSPEPARRA